MILTLNNKPCVLPSFFERLERFHADHINTAETINIFAKQGFSSIKEYGFAKCVYCDLKINVLRSYNNDIHYMYRQQCPIAEFTRFANYVPYYSQNNFFCKYCKLNPAEFVHDCCQTLVSCFVCVIKYPKCGNCYHVCKKAYRAKLEENKN